MGLALVIVGGVEDHRGGGDFRVSADLMHEFETVHGRHQNVGYDERGPLCTRARQTLGAIGGLDDFVALISKQGDEQLSIERYVIHYQYCCHPAADPLPLVEQCHRNGDRAVVIRLRLPHGKRRHRFP